MSLKLVVLEKVDLWDYIAMVLTLARRGIKHPLIPVATTSLFIGRD